MRSYGLLIDIGEEPFISNYIKILISTRIKNKVILIYIYIYIYGRTSESYCQPMY